MVGRGVFWLPDAPLLPEGRKKKKVLSVPNAPKNWDYSSLTVNSAKETEPASDVKHVEMGKGEIIMKER